MKILFKRSRETKGTFVYDECDAKGNVLESKKDGVIGSMYIRKTSEIGKKNADKLTVNIEATK